MYLFIHIFKRGKYYYVETLTWNWIAGIITATTSVCYKLGMVQCLQFGYGGGGEGGGGGLKVVRRRSAYKLHMAKAVVNC